MSDAADISAQATKVESSADMALRGALYGAGCVRWCTTSRQSSLCDCRGCLFGVLVQTGSADTTAGTTGMAVPSLTVGTAGTACRHHRSGCMGTSHEALQEV